MRTSSFITWADLRVLLLTLVSLLLFVLGVYFVGDQVGLFSRKYTLYTYMENVSGLQPGAPVRLAGVNVGTVESIEFIPPAAADSIDTIFREFYGDSLGNRTLEVRLAVDTDVKDRITKSSTASIGTIGLLGDKYVAIDVGEPDDPVLEEAQIVLNELPLDYEALLARGAAAVEELVQSVSNTEQILAKVNEGQGTLGLLINDDRLYEDWVELSRRGATTMERIESGEGALGRLLNDPTLYREMVAVTQELQQLANRIETGQGTIGKLLEDPALYQRMTDLVLRAEGLLDRIDKGDGTAGKLLNDDDLYEQLNKFVVDTQNLINDIRENPRKYLTLQVF